MASQQLTPGTIVVTGVEVSSGAGAVFRIHPTRGTETKVSAAGDFATPIGVAIDAEGNVLIADADAFGGRGGVIRVDPKKKTQNTVASVGLFANPFDLAVEAAGGILVVDPHASGVGGVVRVDPGTGEQTMLSSGEDTGAAAGLREVGIALEANGRILVVEQALAGGQGGGRVTRINQKTGARKVLSSGGSFTSAAGIAVEPDGSIVVADANAFGGSGGVFRVNPKSGKQTTVTSGGSFVSPLGIAVDDDGNILVADSDAFGGKGGIIRVDPKTGEQTKVSTGKKFGGHRRLAVVRGS
jgi:DNA-binding beta-propeller fold protein YncE